MQRRRGQADKGEQIDEKKPVARAATEDGDGGLLVSQRGKLAGRKFLFAVFMEFLGVVFFTLFGNSATPAFGAVGNGLMLAVLVYITANVSGGHLNPAVTAGTLCTGHISLAKGALYIVFQVFGAVVGTLLTVGLVPGSAVGEINDSCFRPGADVTKGQAFGWELFMTFILVSTVYAVAIGKPNFGNVGPLIVGISLWACGTCAGQFTTASLNPARTLGPLAVFHCNKSDAWYYVLAELLGGVLAGLLAWPLYGTGREFGRPLDSEFEEAGWDEDDKKEEAEANEERVINIERGHSTASAHAALEPHAAAAAGGTHSPPLANRNLLANSGAHSSVPPRARSAFQV